MKSKMNQLALAVTIMLFLLTDNAVLAQVPKLNSNNPGLPTVFIDFDGEVITGTSWNWVDTIDAKHSGLNAESVTGIFNSVAEDFKVFNINITTDPSAYNLAPVNKRMRVIVTPTWEWYGQAGGTSYIGSFTWGDETPCWVFSSLLKNNIRNIAEAVSHEIGHTLGLFHQSIYNDRCEKIHEYAPGSGSGATSWAPIMGVSYQKNLSTWAIGTSSEDCNSLQEDIAVMLAAPNQLSLRADEHGNNRNAATQLEFGGNLLQGSGLISNTQDVDFFKFTLPASRHIILQGIPSSVEGDQIISPNLDVKLSLYNSAGTLISVSNPENDIHSIVDTLLNGGIYYVSIEGTGNAYLPGYVSVGSYSIIGSVSGALPIYEIKLTGTSATGSHILKWNVVADEAIDRVILQSSTDARLFRDINISTSERGTYTVKAESSRNFYRLLVITREGLREHYSRVLVIDNTLPTMPAVTISRNNISIKTSSPTEYRVLDATGRLLQAGRVRNAVSDLNISSFPRGLLLLVLYTNGQQTVHKIMKE